MEHRWNSGFSLLTCLLLGVGVSGVSVLLQHRQAIAKKLLSWRIGRLVRVCRRQVYVVQSEAAWNKVLPLLQRDVGGGGALGLDCEWVEVKGGRRPVALLQLATCSGVCVLVRLPSFAAPLPDSLKGQSLSGDKVQGVIIAGFRDRASQGQEYRV
ncbi:Exonuclease 3'-5' domain-containing protein 2 [Chionoecetes opilio]|uniref:Exonuclease 3'-5' domain-containing protein 2 n=1 Tax=Chionoecetes opilio TaxID=41210 RepID=A0A8J4YP75_CHIOP|nr:Exonuclease 3'-5' domain-containing protein 2 [Chionoecetes opilio]